MAYRTPEQIATEVLAPLGFVNVNDTFIPHAFTDKDGVAFRAKADFYHPELELYVEIKHSHLNGKTSKANAEKAYSRVDPIRLATAPTYFQIQHQWNHAAAKQGIVQSTIGRPQFAIVFTKHPDSETLSRIDRHGIQAFSLDRFADIIRLQQATALPPER